MADSDPNVFLSSRTDTSGEGLLTKQSDSPAECEETSKRSASSSFQSCAEEEAQPTDPGPAQPLEEEQRSRVQTLEVSEISNLQLGPFGAGVTCEILRAWYGLPNNPTRQVNATQYCRNAWSNTTGLTMSRTCYNRLFGDPAPLRMKKMFVEYRLSNVRTCDLTNAKYTSRMGLMPVIAAKAVTNMFGATVAASGYVVGKTLTSLQNAVTSDPDNSVADSTIFQTAFSTWLRCNGIVPSVSYDPIPGGTAAPEDMRQTPIILCNHTCYLDGMVLASVFHAPKIIAKKGTLNVPLIGAFAADLGVIEVDRSDPKSRAATIQAIEDHVTSWKSGKQPLLLFPEGTTSNGQHLLEFKKGAFVPGVTVRPAVLYYSGSWDPANVYYRQSDDGKIQAIGDTEWAEQFLGHMMHSVRIRVLPPYKPSQAEKQDAQLFANNVREVMSKAHGELRSEVAENRAESERRSLQAYAHRGVEAVEDVLRYTVGGGFLRDRSSTAGAGSSERQEFQRTARMSTTPSGYAGRASSRRSKKTPPKPNPPVKKTAEDRKSVV